MPDEHGHQLTEGEPTADSIRFHLGSDAAARFAFWIGAPGLTLITILAAITFSSALVGLWLAIWALACLYLWRFNFNGTIEVGDHSLRVVTGLREFEAEAMAVSGITTRGGHLVVLGKKGDSFRVPYYTLTPLNRTLTPNSRSVHCRLQLEREIGSMLNRGSLERGSSENPVWRIRWRFI